MKRVKKTFTIEATEDTMQKFLRFLAFMHFNGGHSGLFAMSFDGDGHEILKVKGGLPDKLRFGNRISNSGATVEIAGRNGTQGWFVNYGRHHYVCDADGNVSKIGFDPEVRP